MEDGGQISNNVGNGGGSRWNPTKDQIDMLEGLYMEGLRTPSAEQIQQITKRLQDFGHIEGKNVFYWFQNHKARQRQRQKQKQKQQENTTTAFYNRLFHLTTPAFPPYHHHNNVMQSQSFIAVPHNEILGLYQQNYPKVPLPTAPGGCFKRKPLLIPEPAILERRTKQYPTNCSSTQKYNKPMLLQNPTTNHNDQETLELFPMHPTGILQAKNKSPCFSENDWCFSGNSNNKGAENGGIGDNHQFYDFFCGKI